MIYIILVILGLALGSFINALVWRIHMQGTHKDAQQELSIVRGRSMCPECRHQLAAKDLIPVISWLSLKGKCRYCNQDISYQYPLVELMTACLFVVSYLFLTSRLNTWLLIFSFALWLLILVGLITLSIYDLHWMLLPNRIIFPMFGLVILRVLVTIFEHNHHLLVLENSLWGLLIGAGLFYFLFQISKGAWIGGGDVKLGGLLGLLVGGPIAILLVIFLSSLIGTVISLPLMLTGNLTRSSKIPYGPLLIIGAIVVHLFGSIITSWLKKSYLIP